MFSKPMVGFCIGYGRPIGSFGRSRKWKRWCGAIEAARVHWREVDETAADIPTAISSVPVPFTPHEDTVDFVVTDPAGTKLAVARYEEARLSVRRQVDPHETSIGEMMKHVVRVVSIEGPVHETEIVARIRSAWGLARAGVRIRDAVQAAIKAARDSGYIAGGPFSTPCRSRSSS